VVWTDADLTYPNERIPEFAAILDEDPTIDQVVGARTSEEGTLKIFRVPAKWFVRKLAERLTNADIPDLNSGLRAFRRPVALPYLKLLPPGFSCVTTITLAFLSNGHEVRCVPIDYAKRAGRSGSGSGGPRSASSARQASIMQPSPAIAHTAAPATSQPSSLASAACTCVHWEASPYTASPAASTSSAARSHGLLVRSDTPVAYSPAPFPTLGRISPKHGDPATRQPSEGLAGSMCEDAGHPDR
jgi:hypothetical protein